ncbi:hypothetical protein IQ247_05835 [Plectonema cf. radiosum LEGE 06105]|uniref:Cyanovirin-N domain-containing protein n=1 Tax=Plectonema cf. radiosum LEGE 06105 TaxID=945769 RepID=A0A8J7JS88_9CYAN|nr:hypothetical protein [Plectonema radiosum]MBE9212234.1 hypothetical protein [Plectonema cf. radiosum LEGE 06105]
MKYFNRKLTKVASFLSFSALNLVFSQPAISAVSCEAGTISRHSNGSLAYCVLARDTKVTVSNSQIGTSIFPCKAKNYIIFAEKSEFQRCTLSEDIKIININSVQTCAEDFIVSISTSSDNKNLSINCERYE